MRLTDCWGLRVGRALEKQSNGLPLCGGCLSLPPEESLIGVDLIAWIILGCEWTQQSLNPKIALFTMAF